MLDRDRAVDLLIQYRKKVRWLHILLVLDLEELISNGETSFGKFYQSLDEIQSAHSARLCFSLEDTNDSKKFFVMRR